MYNRYIPQPDGTYSRRQVPDSQREPPPRPQKPEPEPEERKVEASPCQNCVHNPPPRRPMPPKLRKNTQNISAGSFLKQLLPKDFDTEDLLIILLLLLMAGDCHEDQNSAMLTLALYLFM